MLNECSEESTGTEANSIDLIKCSPMTNGYWNNMWLWFHLNNSTRVIIWFIMIYETLYLPWFLPPFGLALNIFSHHFFLVGEDDNKTSPIILASNWTKPEVLNNSFTLLKALICKANISLDLREEYCCCSWGVGESCRREVKSLFKFEPCLSTVLYFLILKSS